MHWNEIYLWNVPKDFIKHKMREVSLHGTVFDLSVNHSIIEKKWSYCFWIFNKKE